MKICPKCHKTFDDSQNFCDNCGTGLVSAQSENVRMHAEGYLICPVCGRHFSSGQVFCPDDGARLISSTTGKEVEASKLSRPEVSSASTVRGLPPKDPYASEFQQEYTPEYDTDYQSDYSTQNEYHQTLSQQKKNSGPIIAIIVGILAGALCAVGFLIHSGIISLPFGNGPSSKGGYISSSETGSTGETDDSGNEKTANIDTTQNEQDTGEEEQEESSPVSNLNVTSIENAVENAADGGTVSFAVIDMDNGTIVGSDNMSDAQSASVIIDIPILYTAMKSVENGSLNLSTQVTFTYEVDGRGQLKQSDSGNTYPLEDLLSYMLHYSDNNATNSLLNYLSYDTINSICSKNGYSVNIVQKIGKTDDYTSNDNYLSAEDTAKMLYEIWNSNTDLNKNFLSRYMVIQDSTRTAGIGKNIDSSVSDFMNFNAVKKDKYNEVAIVVDGDNTYGIVFLGNHGKMETLEDAAAVLGDEVHSGM